MHDDHDRRRAAGRSASPCAAAASAGRAPTIGQRRTSVAAGTRWTPGTHGRVTRRANVGDVDATLDPRAVRERRGDEQHPVTLHGETRTTRRTRQASARTPSASTGAMPACDMCPSSRTRAPVTGAPVGSRSVTIKVAGPTAGDVPGEASSSRPVMDRLGCLRPQPTRLTANGTTPSTRRHRAGGGRSRRGGRTRGMHARTRTVAWSSPRPAETDGSTSRSPSG